MMRRSPYIAIFITASTDKEARRISNALLTQKKVACVNVIPRVHSRFWWQGKIDSASEVMLVAKTKSRLLSDVIKLVKSLHSYDVPEIIALPIIGGNKDYLRWISKSVKKI